MILKKIQFYVLILLIIFGVSWIWHHLKPSPLKNLVSDISQAVENVRKSGMNQQVEFTSSGNKAIILICPPYASLKEYENYFDAGLMKQVEDRINAVETGHIFYIKNNRIEDRAWLPGDAEPVLGLSDSTHTRFLISKKETSGRPVRIEIIS